MKKLFILYVVMHVSNGIHAQLYDANWITGYLPVSTLNFIGDTIVLDSLQGGLDLIATNACISDENGNLLYYTNGININNTLGILLNGDSLNPCSYTNNYSIIGLNIQQSAIFIPMPGSLRYYYLFHFSNDDTINGGPSIMYYSLIDKEENGGQGAVIAKNVPFMQDTPLREGGMTACKHGNGRDYWLVMGASVVNKFYKFLITPDSILGPFIQTIGPQFPLPFDNAYSKFSQDGTKYATGVFEGPILVMDFDRCSGEFSNPITIFNESCDSPQSCSGSSAIEFSPDGRFLYVSNVFEMNQYDLLDTNIQDSVQVYLADSNDAAGIDMIQLGANGKLYGSTWNGGFYFYHLVNKPDLKGDSCNFVWGGQSTYSENSGCLSNLINYKLGALVSSGCDTVPAALNPTPRETSLLRIMPNPADKYAYVEMGMQGNYEFDLLNTVGQVIDRKETKQIDIFDTENLSTGIYLLQVMDKNNTNKILTQKLVVQH